MSGKKFRLGMYGKNPGDQKFWQREVGGVKFYLAPQKYVSPLNCSPQDV